MSDDGGSEEKTLPPSAKKLRDARKRGQVAQSKDMVVAVGTLTAVAYLAIRAPSIVERLQAMFLTVGRLAYEEPRSALAVLFPQLAGLAIGIVAPLVVAIVLASVLTSMVLLKGPVLALEPIKPKLEKLDPVKGFKRIFSLRNVIEFAKSLVKATLLFALLAGLILLDLQDILRAPAAGASGLAAVGGAVLLGLAAVVGAVFLTAGLLDVGLQQWLFRRDLRMGHTEARRERKDQEGDPHVRAARRGLAREMVFGDRKAGLRHATLVLADPGRGEIAVALRFRRGETPAPIVVGRAKGQAATRLCANAYRFRVPILDDARLAGRVLASGTALGEPIPQSLFNDVAKALVLAKAL